MLINMLLQNQLIESVPLCAIQHVTEQALGTCVGALGFTENVYHCLLTCFFKESHALKCYLSKQINHK